MNKQGESAILAQSYLKVEGMGLNLYHFKSQIVHLNIFQENKHTNTTS